MNFGIRFSEVKNIQHCNLFNIFNIYYFNMRSLFKKTKTLGLLKGICRQHYYAITKLPSSFITYKYSTFPKSPSDHQTDVVKKSVFEKLNSINTRIEDQLSKIVDYLKKNQEQFDHFLSHSTLNVQLFIQDLQLVKRQLELKRRYALAATQEQCKSGVEFFQSIQQYIQRCEIQSQDHRPITQLLKIIEITIKLKNVVIFFSKFTKPKNLVEMQSMKNVQIVQLEATQDIDQQYQGFQKVLHLILAIAKYFSYPQPISLQQRMKNYLRYLSEDKIVLNSLQIHYRQDLKLLIKSLGVADWPSVKPIIGMTLPKITTNLMIYVPMGTKNESEWDVFKFSQNAIPVRVLYHDVLPHLKEGRANNNQLLKQNIMFHIHGGGFIGLSSHTAQLYTRTWTNQSKMVLFSIDYRLAPQSPFPDGLQDCKKAYEFILRNIERIFKIRPKNVYVGGDSAGGNLTCSLTAQILKNNWRLPNGLFLVFPFLDATANFYGSRKYLVNDPLLWPSLGNLALKSYITSYKPENPLISPLYLTQGFISGEKEDERFPINWPPTYIHVGEKDPLRDESLILMQKMMEQNIKCKCYVMSKLMHGYVCTDGLITASREAIIHSAKALKQLAAETLPKQS